MHRVVVDASVLATLFLGEEESEDIEVILETLSEIHAPLFWRYEVTNAIWRRKEISEEKGKGLIERIWRFPTNSETSSEAAKEAFHISRKFNLPFYDSSYIAMAKKLNIPLWTLDKLQGNTAIKAGVSLWEK